MVNLPLADDEGRPLWNIHPRWGHRVDVAALPIAPPANAALFPIETFADHTYTKIAAGDPVAIIGFPRGLGLFATGGLWKRGSIATEPKVDVDGLPKILVDTATRQGMSGSPVFVVDNVIVGDLDPSAAADPHEPWRSAPIYSFLGIYSGRVGEDEFLSQLGIVWKRSVLAEIVRGRTKFAH